MRKVVVSYEVKPELADQNQVLVERVFAELDEQGPGGVRYATFRLADGVSFVHVASIETDDGSNPLAGINAFGEFGRRIEDRCTKPPAAQDAVLVGSYRLLAQ